MIHGVFGKLGSGKGLYVMDIIARELMDGVRDIVTNVPVRVVPWVNGQGTPQIGLRAYLVEKLYPLAEEEIDEILKRVLVIEDPDQGFDLFLRRRDGETGEWFKLDVTRVDEKGRPSQFDPKQIKERHAMPCLVVTDEAWAFYPNNGGWSRAPILNFYSRQQRKLKDEWYIVSQHPTDCDDVFWKIAQDFHVCRNYGMERIGIFKKYGTFEVKVYLTNPARGNAILSYRMERRLDRKLCQCYDTTGGVGFAGGFKGDAGSKRSGISLNWLIVAVIIGLCCLAVLPWAMGNGAKFFLKRAMPQTNPTKWSGVPGPDLTNATPLKARSELFPRAAVISQSAVPGEASSNGTPGLFCVGFSYIGKNCVVFLSDGTDYDSQSQEVNWVTKRRVCVLGKIYDVKSREPLFVPDPSPAVSSDGPSYFSQVRTPKRIEVLDPAPAVQ
jgi:hypothetical protein